MPTSSKATGKDAAATKPAPKAATRKTAPAAHDATGPKATPPAAADAVQATPKKRTAPTAKARNAAQADDGLGTLKSSAATFGITLSDDQVAAFARYRELLLDWNQRINLTAITDPAEVVTLHFLDSLSVLLGVPEELRNGPARVLDVGSGAGFPGLALAIALPAWRVTALEATSKKVRFLEHVVSALRLSNARPVDGRAEVLAHDKEERGRYDLVVARALAPLPILLEYCQPFARVGGVTIAPKKGDIAEELAAGGRAAAQLGGELLPAVPVNAPGLDDGRVLAAVRQERLSLPLYPRSAGAPTKHPLGR
jgi:16S rRNA (guanine527-N7)-methyltransferase